MKTAFASMLMAMLGIIFMSACSSDSPENTGGTSGNDGITVPDNILRDGISFGQSGGSAKPFNIGCSGTPSVTVSADWLTAKIETIPSLKSVFSVTVEAMANSQPEQREATFTISCGSDKATVTVRQEAAPAEEKPTPAPFEVAKTLGLGWNLGNQMDAYVNGVADETSWGNPRATQKLFDAIAASGIKTVRIPVTWLGQFGEAPSYTINKAWLDRVAEIAGYAENAGMNVIINIHHDGADGAHWLDIKKAANDPKVNEATKKQIAAIWTQIADRFKNKGDSYILETFNEIHDGGWGWGDNRKDGGKQYRTLNEWNQTALDAIRATGGNNATRYVAVPGYVTNPELTIENLVMPSDPANHTIVAVHFYDPNDYTLEAKFSEWGHTGKDKASWGDEDNVKNIFARLKSKFIDKGIPVYIGEMGSVNRADNRAGLFRQYYMEYVAKAAHDCGLAPIIWDNGANSAGKECSGLFNRATGEFYGDGGTVISRMVKAVSSDDASYTLESVYNSAPK